MIHEMIAAPIPPTATQPPSTGRSPNDRSGSNSSGASDQLSFDALMTAVASAQRVPVAFMSQTLARNDTLSGQTHADSRGTRLAMLRQSDADSRIGGESRISGANRSAVDTDTPKVADSTSGDVGQQRGDSAPTDGNRSVPDVATRFAGSAARANTPGPGPSRLSDITSPPTTQNRDPQSASDERTPSDQAGSRRGEPVTPPTAPAQSAPSALAVRPSSGDVAVDRIGRVSAARGASGSEVRNGSQDASSGVAQLRGKGGRTASQHAVNETRKQNQPQAGRMAPYERVSEAIRTMKNGKDWVTRIRLDPPSLGSLRIEVRMSGETVRVRLTAETADAQKTLTSQLSELRASLEEHGLRLDRIDITTPNRDGATPNQSTPDESSHTTNPHRDVSDGGSRREDRETSERGGESLRSSPDEPVLMSEGDGETLVGVGWLDVHA